MPGEKESYSAILPQGQEIKFLEEPLNEATANLAEDAEAISVFVKSEVKQAVLDKLPNLKLITTRSVGFDHIDVEYARTKGIHVGNVQTYAAHPVAEFAFALMLATIRKICTGYNRLREGTIFDTRNLGGFNLFGKTLGVIGTGRIGKNVVKIGQGFGMNVVAYDPFPDNAFAAEQKFSYVAIDELLAKSDVITIHALLTKETFHLLNTDAFAKMKKGVVVVNDARGEIIDTIALVTALQNGTVAAVGLDVLEEERDLKEEELALASKKPGVNYEILSANHVLIDHPNVVITPHIAFETKEALEEITRVTAETIANFVNGTEQKYL